MFYLQFFEYYYYYQLVFFSDRLERENIYYNIFYRIDECIKKAPVSFVEDIKYKESLSAGASKEEALKEFDVSGGDFSFYKEAIAGGLNPDSHEAKELMVNGTIKMWKE